MDSADRPPVITPRYLLPVLLLAFVLPAFGTDALALKPGVACNLLEDARLQARGGYRRASDERYRCASFRKNLTAGSTVPHDLMFFAEGNEKSVDRLGLELRIRSREDVQRALRILADTADDLSQRGIGQSLEPAVRTAILDGTDGRWMQNGFVLRLDRDAFAPTGFKMKFTIE